jgi:hypothetical protein
MRWEIPSEPCIGDRRAVKKFAFFPIDVPNIEDSALKQLKNLAVFRPACCRRTASLSCLTFTLASAPPWARSSPCARPSSRLLSASISAAAWSRLKTSLTASDLPDNLKPVRDQIERDIPVGFASTSATRTSTELAKRQGPVLPVRGTVQGVHRHRNEGVEGSGTTRHARRWQPLHRTVPGREGSCGSCCTAAPVAPATSSVATSSARRRSRWSRCTSRSRTRTLAYLVEGGAYFADYRKAVSWAQDYAFKEPCRDAGACHRGAASDDPGAVHRRDEAINCHHNYVEQDTTSVRACTSPARALCVPQRRPRHHPRQHGPAQLHRAWQGQPGVVLLVQPRRRAGHVSQGSGEALHRR